MNRQLVDGNPRKALWIYSLPLLFSVMFQQLYNIADSIIAGRFIGENALASVGNASEIILIYTAVSIGGNIGCSVVVSQLFGAKRYRDVKTAVTTSFCAFAVVCAVLVGVGYLITPALLHAIKTPAEIYEGSWTYLKIYTAGVPFVMFYNVATGIFSALGDSKTPFAFLAFSSVSNIFVDILFVTVFGMEIDGVAYATILCQGVSCILALIILARKLKKFEIDGKPQIFSKPILKSIVTISIPSILQQSFISVGNIVVQGVINQFGPAVIAGFTASMKINSIAINSFVAIGNGMSTYTAQNIGAGKKERVKDGCKAGLTLQYIICALFTAVFVVFGKFFVKSFMDNPTEDALKAGMQFLLIVAPFYFSCSTKIVIDGILRGAGAVKYFTTSTFVDLALRVVLSFVLSIPFRETGIWISWPIGWIIGTALSIYFYKRVMKEKKECAR